MSTDLERIARLEERQSSSERAVAEMTKESREDRLLLHDTLNKLTLTLDRWQSRQGGFIAGVSFILALFAAGVAAGWREIVAYLKGGL